MTEIRDDTIDTIVVDNSSQDTIQDANAMTDTLDTGNIMVVDRAKIEDVLFNGESVVVNKIATIPNELSQYTNDANYTKMYKASSYLNFPAVGDALTIYIDTTANETYRWDTTDLYYYIIGSDWHDIEIINGGNA